MLTARPKPTGCGTDALAVGNVPACAPTLLRGPPRAGASQASGRHKVLTKKLGSGLERIRRCGRHGRVLVIALLCPPVRLQRHGFKFVRFRFVMEQRNGLGNGPVLVIALLCPHMCMWWQRHVTQQRQGAHAAILNPKFQIYTLSLPTRAPVVATVCDAIAARGWTCRAPPADACKCMSTTKASMA